MELLQNKKLLLLLSPYADKTLSEGCYIKNKSNEIYFKIEKQELKLYKENRFEILGHIGITTVLKYIERKIGYSVILDNGFFQVCDDDGNRIQEEGIYKKYDDSIPNKELQLYTKQELEELYNLLINLK